MEANDLFNLLIELDIPVAYDHFDERTEVFPPFLVYRERKPDSLAADNRIFYSFPNYELELVTENKDFELENKIKQLLSDNGIVYDKPDEIWDKDEKIYHIFFEI